MRALFMKLTYGIQNRIFVSFSIFFILSVFAFSVYNITYVSDVMSRQNEDTLHSLTMQMTGAFDNYIDSIKDSLLGLANDQTVANIINSSYSDDTDRYYQYFTFYEASSRLLRFGSFDTNQIYLINPADDFILSSNAYFHLNKAASPWLEFLESNKQYYYYLLDFKAPKPMQDVMAFTVAVNVSTFSRNYIMDDAYLVMVAGRSRFRYAMKQLNDMPFATLIIWEDDGGIVYSHRSSEADRPFTQALREGIPGDTVSINGTSYKVYSQRSENTGWYLTFFYDQMPIAKTNRLVVRNTIPIAVLAIAVLLAIAYFIAQSITKPVKKLSTLMDEMGRGNTQVSLASTSNDEIGKLGEHFNKMTDKINTLINQVYHEEMLRKDAEFRALQQQINPHFLYNTLEVINALTNRGDSASVKLVTRNIAGIFRYCVTEDSAELVEVSSELQYNDSYIAIQQIRFDNSLEYTADVGEELVHCRMPKFLLQPLVENCFIHGFPGKRIRGAIIRVRCRRDGDMVYFDVEDNGVGIAPQQLAAIRDRLAQSVANRRIAPAGAPPAKTAGGAWKEDRPSIALCNVHTRIRLKYGEPFGLTIESRLGYGTRVTLCVPYLQREQKES